MRRTTLMAPLAIVVALVCVLGLTACKPQTKSLIGTWRVSMGSQVTTSSPVWQFTPDGKMIQKAGGNAQDTTAGYSVSGDTVTLKVSVNGTSSDTTMAIQWVSNDEFKGTIGGMGKTQLTFTRQK